VLHKYERVTFDRGLVRPAAAPRADLLAPGHPLLDAVTDLVIERYGSLLKHGTMLVNRHDPSDQPCLLAAITQEITDGHDPARTVSKRFDFAEISPAGAEPAAQARYLDYEPIDPTERNAVATVVTELWLRSGVDQIAVDWAIEHGMPALLAQTREQVCARTGQTRRLVRQRLTQEINYWDARHAELLEAERPVASSRSARNRVPPSP